ncbi:MAG TPA: hypothetical protein VHQ87_00755 [Rhizobacter sp.]|nr:hypothetical protein [Rhizobacter sp.]
MAIAVCYFIPGVVVAGLIAAGFEDILVPYIGQAITTFLAFLSFLVLPVAGGYFAARISRTRPWSHVLVVGVLGALLSLVAFRGPPRAMAAYIVASVALAAFGGFIRLGATRRS